MPLVEINFDGIVGPSHNYAGLSFGNVASMRHSARSSQPRAAALQGIEKMRANLALGLTQGIFVPHPPAPTGLGWKSSERTTEACRAILSRPARCRLQRCGRRTLPRSRPRRTLPTANAT